MDEGELAPSEVRVWVVDLDAGVSPENLEQAEPGPELALLADDERTRAARFVRARDRRRFVCCRAALREILGGLMQASPGSLRFRVGGQGKPELDPGGSPTHGGNAQVALRFNVSHSSELALIAACRGHELGVDVERVRPINEADRIVTSYFTPAEQAEFATFAPQAKVMAFFRGWTRKEAILKGLGIGLSGLASRYETRFGTTELTGHFTPASPSPRVVQWQLWEVAPRAGFVATVAVHVPTTADLAALHPSGLGSDVACTGEDAVN